MRVTAGLYKGQRVCCPPGPIRPAMAKLRESLFSILGSRLGVSAISAPSCAAGGGVAGCRFLDLFSGSGLMAVEAASRGAAYVEAVERDRRKKKILLQNLGLIAVPFRLYLQDVRSYFAQQQKNLQQDGGDVLLEPKAERREWQGQPFDIIYLDPPFAMPQKAGLLQQIPLVLLRPGSIVAMHLPRQEGLPDSLGNGLECLQTKYYGGSSLWLYQLPAGLRPL